MNPRKIIGSGITASAVAHLSLLLVLVFYAEVHPFAAVPTESIAVDVVAPEDVAEVKPEPQPVPKLPDTDVFDPAAKPLAPSAAAPPPAAATPPPAKQAARPPERAKPQQQAKAEPPTPTPPPQAAPPPPAAPPPQSASPAQAYAAPQPDLTVKYNVMLGLPPATEAPPQNRPGETFDAPASAAADIASDVVMEFRRHLAQCAKLPASMARSDHLKIKLRISLTRDGQLSGAPVLIEGSASAKGPLLMQSAISALEACQPYAMLPPDKYREWKTLDLVFTPQDFGGAS